MGVYSNLYSGVWHFNSGHYGEFSREERTVDEELRGREGESLWRTEDLQSTGISGLYHTDPRQSPPVTRQHTRQQVQRMKIWRPRHERS